MVDGEVFVMRSYSFSPEGFHGNISRIEASGMPRKGTGTRNSFVLPR
jgi:hypothetical protein